MNKYIIIPGCSDLNRGDQALVWETKHIAEEAGYKGEYYLTTEKNEPTHQSEEEGLHIIRPILEHPSRIFNNKENLRYGLALKARWGAVAIFDFVCSMLYLLPLTRTLMKKIVSEEKKQSIKVFETADAVFVKGGGLLQTYGGITSTYSMYFWVYHIILAAALKKPVYVMPNSMGPFEGPGVKWIARFALRKCKMVTSREVFTQKKVREELGLKIENYPDLAFFLKKTEIEKKDIFQRYQLPSDKKLVAITVRPYRFPKAENPEDAYRKFKIEISLFIKWLYESGYMPVIVEHTLAINSHENDAACIRDVTAMLDNYMYRIISDKTLNCRDLKAIYGMCDYIVGTRFHSVIFSLGCGVPSIAISYVGNKTLGIMHDIGLDDYVVAIDDVSCEALKKRFEQLLREEMIVKKKINRYLQEADKSYAVLCRKIQDKSVGK